MPTSVPTWPTTAPDVDASGRSFAVLAVRGAEGGEAQAVADGWCRRLEELGLPVVRHSADAGDAGALAWADDCAARARVGWRFLVVGPEDDVLRACAAVRARGALDAELTAHVTRHVTGAALRRVRCAHCRSETLTSAPVGAECDCTGCGLTLHVYHHHSRRTASYLGFMADAEESS